MHNTEAMDIDQALKNLAKEAPDLVCFFIKISLDQITKSLNGESAMDPSAL